jgi:hypothetical protein
LKKESWIILIIFFVLSIVFHSKEFLEYPLEHLNNLPNSAAYGLGYYHPLVFTLFVYIIILIPRFISGLFKKK